MFTPLFTPTVHTPLFLIFPFTPFCSHPTGLVDGLLRPRSSLHSPTLHTLSLHTISFSIHTLITPLLSAPAGPGGCGCRPGLRLRLLRPRGSQVPPDQARGRRVAADAAGWEHDGGSRCDRDLVLAHGETKGQAPARLPLSRSVFRMLLSPTPWQCLTQCLTRPPHWYRHSKARSSSASADSAPASPSCIAADPAPPPPLRYCWCCSTSSAMRCSCRTYR
jgi:hypothetical protein